MANKTSQRDHERILAWEDRGSYPKCDLCGQNKAEHYHEIITRMMTMLNAEARELSFSRFICACLCENCHMGNKNAHSDAVADTLLRQNIRRYGYSAVAEAYFAVQNVMNSQLPIKLPDPESDLIPYMFSTGNYSNYTVQFIVMGKPGQNLSRLVQEFRSTFRLDHIGWWGEEIRRYDDGVNIEPLESEENIVPCAGALGLTVSMPEVRRDGILMSHGYTEYGSPIQCLKEWLVKFKGFQEVEFMEINLD